MEKTCKVCGSNPPKSNTFIPISGKFRFPVKRECAKSVCGLKAGDTAAWKEEQHSVKDIEKR